MALVLDARFPDVAAAAASHILSPNIFSRLSF